MINSSNYKIYLVDYVNNNLTTDEIAALMLFLSTDTNASEEFKLLNSDNYTTDFKKKDFTLLKKPLYNDVKESLNLLLIEALENDISKGNIKKLNTALAAYPELNIDKKLIYKTKLSPDKHIVFLNKSQLKKNITPVYYKIVAFTTAVAAALLVGMFLFLNNSNIFTSSKIITANNKQVKQPLTHKSVVAQKIPVALIKTNKLQLASLQIKKESLLKVEPRPVNYFSISKPELSLPLTPVTLLDGDVYKLALHKNTDDYKTISEMIAQKILKHTIGVTDSIKQFDVFETAGFIAANNNIISFKQLKDHNGNKNGFNIVTKLFSIEKINGE